MIKIICRNCKKILEGKQVKGLFGSNKIVCPLCNGENIKAVEFKGDNERQG